MEKAKNDAEKLVREIMEILVHQREILTELEKL
jgi:hypothetical protein